MLLVDLKVERVGSGVVLINGEDMRGGHGKHTLREELFYKDLTLDQQHMVICEVRQLLARMLDSYTRKQVAENELTVEGAREIMKQRRKVRSASGGISGTSVGPLVTRP